MKVFILIAILMVSGCVTSYKERIVVYRTECENLGATEDYMVECIQRKEQIRAINNATMLQKHRNVERLLNHGIGGCTPDLLTGGCL